MSKFPQFNSFCLNWPLLKLLKFDGSKNKKGNPLSIEYDSQLFKLNSSFRLLM